MRILAAFCLAYDQTCLASGRIDDAVTAGLADPKERGYFLYMRGWARRNLSGLPVKSARKRGDGANVSTAVWLGGLAVRTTFIASLIVITARVASPQIERLWTLLDTPGDLIRVALGFAVCVWLLVHIFILPKDPGGYRTWLYLGLFLLPLTVLCAVVIW